MTSPTEITVAQLARLAGTPLAPVLLDVRTDEDYDDDPRLIPGARRHGFTAPHSALPLLAGRAVVVYCQKGFKISQGFAAQLRAGGVAADTLKGGQFAWRDAGLDMIEAAECPARDAQGRTQWVTGHRPGLDALACCWLIRRFVDPEGVVLFVEPGQVGNVADRFGAAAFGCAVGRWPAADGTTAFAALAGGLGLRGLASGPMAAIIDRALKVPAAGSKEPPQAAGLVAVFDGLSALHAADLARVEAGSPVFDGLYRWSRGGLAGADQPEST